MTMQEVPDGQKVPEYGLMPPGVLADWNVFGHRFMLQGLYYRGLLGAAGLLDQIGDPMMELNKIRKFLTDLRNDVEHREDMIKGVRF